MNVKTGTVRRNRYEPRNRQDGLRHRNRSTILSTLLYIPISILLTGCSGYSNQSLYPQDIESVCVQMFDNDSFRRGVEYELTDALAKRIEAVTPYKVISSSESADTVISGRIISAESTTLSAERQTGRSLERQVRLTAVVKWENLKTGKYLLDNETISASATFSEWQNQSFEYASSLAANKLAEKIVERMAKKW